MQHVNRDWPLWFAGMGYGLMKEGRKDALKPLANLLWQGRFTRKSSTSLIWTILDPSKFPSTGLYKGKRTSGEK
jgi:hypothetical protein